MKAKKNIIGLLLCLLMMNGCPLSKCDMIHAYFPILLSFQDALGNDLVKGIGYIWHEEGDVSHEGIGGMLKRDLYTLELVYPNRCMDPYAYYREPWPPGVIYEENVPLFGVSIRDKWYLTHSPISLKECGRVNWITFRFTCPYIFGDDTVQEIVTYWKGMRLTRITFNGEENPFQEVEVVIEGARYTSFRNIINIILDDR